MSRLNHSRGRDTLMLTPPASSWGEEASTRISAAVPSLWMMASSRPLNALIRPPFWLSSATHPARGAAALETLLVR